MPFPSILLVALVWSGAPGAPVAAPGPLERFSWLSGCWAGEVRGGRATEMWVAATPELMLGLAFTTRAGRPPEFEFLRLEARDGGVAYVAQPQGNPPTAFALQSDSAADEAVFTNPAHDFPTRVGYRRVSNDALLAWISGEDAAKRVEYPMRRTGCPPDSVR